MLFHILNQIKEMYLYQDYLRLGEALKNEKEKQLLIDMRKGIEKRNDTREIMDSFNPLCSICNSKLCTTAFNTKFKTCSHHADPLM